jgi:alpha-galactosidase
MYKKDENGEYIRQENGMLIEDTPDGYKDEKNLERIVREQNSFGRDIVFSSSPNHNDKQDAMMSRHANMWRITKDIKPVWEDVERALGAELHERIYASTKPGHYADLDMLQIGPKYESFTKDRAPLTAPEQYSMVSLWTLLAQPMLLSCDLDLISEFTLNLMRNYEVIDINQDRLCKPAERFELDDTGKLLLYKKTLNNGQYAVGLINVSDDNQDIAFTLEQLDLDGKWKFRDVWRQKDIGTVSDTFTATLDGHGSLLLVLGKE